MIEHFYQDLDGWFDFPHVYREALARLPGCGNMVEVGVCYGKSFFFLAVEAINAEIVLTMNAVDPFRWPADVWPKYTASLARVDHSVTIRTHRGLSVPMSKRFDNQSQDFVFIDAEHTYEQVKADIEAWWPKVKSGGVLAGHDWGPEFPGVEKAVWEFSSVITRKGELVRTKLIPCEASEGDEISPSRRYCWWLEKR